MIELTDVHVNFGKTDVLTGVDLAVEEGELVGLVGPNGAGKTSLLRTITGLLSPNPGTVRVDGDRVTDLDAREVSRRVASVPQNTHLEFAFTVEQIVEMGRTPHRSRLDWSASVEAVDMALERTQTAHLHNRRVDDLSGGERQRVLLARALAQEAPILVLDEPTGSLDVNHQIRVLNLIQNLVDDSHTAIAAIHDLNLAARYCDRLALLYDGTIQHIGQPREVLQSATVEAAFNTAAAVTENPLTATPRVTAIGDRPQQNTHVHIVGGGRQAARALGDCWAAGYTVSAGIVPAGDAIEVLATDLDVPVVTVDPFRQVSTDSLTKVANFLNQADVVVRATTDPNKAMRRALDDVETVVRWTGSDGVLRDPTEPSPARSQTPPESPAGPTSSVVRAVREAISDGSSSDD